MRGVAAYTEMPTAITNPRMTTTRALAGPKLRLHRSVTKKAIG